MTRISVITVCRNDIAGLKQTFQSIFNQDYSDFEWLVIDGNSADGTVQWLREFHQLKGSWISEPDSGIYDAMNKGIDLATGEYLLFMNSGDMLSLPETLSKLLRAIDGIKSVPDFVYGDALDVEADGTQHYRRSRHISHIRIGMITRHQSMLYRREFIVHERYQPHFKLSGDYALTANILMKDNVNVLQVDFPVCRFALGGAHDEQRIRALREDYKIRKEILAVNHLACLFLFCVHLLHHYIRTSFPNLNKALVYKRQ